MEGVVGFIFEGLTFIGKMSQILLNVYVMEDVFLVQKKILDTGEVVNDLVFYSSRMTVPLAVLVFEPTEDLLNSYMQALGSIGG